MKIIFMGNSIIACPILNSLNNSKHDLIGVVSNSPKPAGRGRSSMYTPVGQLANELGLNFIPAKSLNDKVLIDTIRKLEADIFVVVAFRILPKIIFSLSKKGAINLHGPLLPKYRGAAPIQHSLLNGDKLTGVSTFLIDKIFFNFRFFPMIWKFQSVAKTPIGPEQNVDGPHTAGVARTR